MSHAAVGDDHYRQIKCLRGEWEPHLVLLCKFKLRNSAPLRLEYMLAYALLHKSQRCLHCDYKTPREQVELKDWVKGGMEPENVWCVVAVLHMDANYTVVYWFFCHELFQFLLNRQKERKTNLVPSLFIWSVSSTVDQFLFNIPLNWGVCSNSIRVRMLDPEDADVLLSLCLLTSKSE